MTSHYASVSSWTWRLLAALWSGACIACARDGEPSAAGSTASKLSRAARADSISHLIADTLRPAIITTAVPGDSDDPAIWIDPNNAALSRILGTDKGDS